MEAHVRTYVIDEMLAALRWVIVPGAADAIENMIPEAQVDPETGARRFMDYLGYERTVDKPLLVVEAKRPSEFPIPANGSMETAAALMSNWLVDPDSGLGEWKKWLSSLRNYVQSVKLRTGRFPVRAAITDGNWLVIFEKPENAFAPGAKPNPDFIHVFTSEAEIIERYNHVFELLDQREVSREAREIPPGAIRGAVDPNHIVSLLHGLRLRYTSSETVGHLVPTISVMAIIFLRSDTGSWFKVAHEVPDTESIRIFPYRYEDALAGHLDDVRRDATRLLERVQHWLQKPIGPSSLLSHYQDDAFEGMHGFEEIPGRDGDYWVVTGQETHFLLSAPEELACPFHDFGRAREAQCQALESPLVSSSIKAPRAYFTNGKAHHCCNEDVLGAKRILIEPDNIARCGARSGRIKDKFCEVTQVEELLCCRLCAFQDVCRSSDILILPCNAP
ncbi:MAG TPA: hypothetical protein VMU57_19995 [Edaphobacter sp.]|uniref:hypothetical protein n=1 Tax=Edaphobacter sp. TaxID=1934404 RepID=UPI002C87A5B5|nr:hypothetical protein [Edaphobacter sp.]HUZ97193.1 hypothetical protein [Edaphobacter sp.]